MFYMAIASENKFVKINSSTDKCIY